MSVFKIALENPKQYVHAISGVTKLTSKEAELLGEMISFMHLKNITIIDDTVKAHITKLAGYKHPQGYYNLICSLKRKKLLLYSRKKMQLRPILKYGTTLEITFKAPETISELAVYEQA